MSESNSIARNSVTMPYSNESLRKILLVAFLLCLICSTVVTGVAIGLRPLQVNNAQFAQKREILKVAELDASGNDVDTVFAKNIVVKIVDLRTGKYAENIELANFDERRAARSEGTSIKLAQTDDIAQIRRRSNFSRVYLIYNANHRVETIILPIHGYGLWSIMYGYIGLTLPDNSIKGLTFYEHNETAGLGSEISNPQWLAQFKGKPAFDSNGKPTIHAAKITYSEPKPVITATNETRTNASKVATGRASSNEQASVPQPTFDAISGATLTTNGVTNLLQFWLGDLGFGPYLKRLKKEYR